MAKICMNEVCQATTTFEWKKGWGLKSGAFATLCYNCGSAYENLVYCETFHLEESGWRECRLCGKRIHCGCIASKYLHEYLDFGGIRCISCAKSLETCSIRPIQIPNDDIPKLFGPLTTNNIGDMQSSYVENRMGGISLDREKLMPLYKTMNAKELSYCPQTPRGDTNASIGQIEQEKIVLPIGEVGAGFPDLVRGSVGSSIFANPENNRPIQGEIDMYKSLAQPSRSLFLGIPLDTPNSVQPSPAGAVERREQNKVPPVKQGTRTRYILPKPPKIGLNMSSEANKGMLSQTRVLRLPDEGQGRNQLLPRYWPRITDQELQQISGDLNSTIVPLFEKVLSASDAGRIGRFILPKACAEAYFPPISRSEGLPIKIQDIKGKEWTFQFRFWPNNNSRMYVLEGITPCIQNMHLQAGDIVTFSRIDPGGKLVMGFRKASNFFDMQGCRTPAISNGAPARKTSVSGVNENMPTAFNEKHGGRTNKESLQRPMPIPGKKSAQNIGSKSKRLLMHSEDVMELRLTWEEAQELLRPPPSAKPTIVMIEDQEFQEYDEPPVFGKRTILISQVSGFSCSAPDEVNPEELESLLGVGKDFKKQRITESPKVAKEREPSGLDALANAAALGDIADDSGEPSAGGTTKHPRHHSGCSCIVCIQHPRGKGKHKSTCICDFCSTVQCRFKTIILCNKKRRSEREAEITRYESEMDGKSGHALQPINPSEDERNQKILFQSMSLRPARDD